MVSFVSYEQLHKDVLDFARKAPNDLAGIIGIPRSGMLVASSLALQLNTSVTDLYSFAKCGEFTPGGRRLESLQRRPSNMVLVVDDSVNTGRSMEEALRLLVNFPGFRFIAGALYLPDPPPDCKSVDIYLRTLRRPRLFEWNFFHHPHLTRAMCDLDGFICADPAVDDDGPVYREFIRHAPMLYRVTRVGTIVTCRLEKWRQETEAWLHRHGVDFTQLLMMDYATARMRRLAGNYAAWKADHYSKSDAILFIESSAVQARTIAEICGRPVLCIEDSKIYPASPSS